MHRQAAVTGALVISVAILVTAARALGGAQFGPAQAAGRATAVPALDASAIVELPETMHLVSVVEPAAVAAPAPASAATAPSDEPASARAAIATAPRTAAPVVPTPAPAVAPVPVAPAPAPVATTCPAGSWFCYPRLGISGAIVPYSDCTGSTDVGTQIRSFTCLSTNYLMAHAYTQFGKITGWQAGDKVIAYGRTFTVTGAFVQSSCTQPRLPLAPLEMQTSLTPYSCGDVLVVQAN